MKNLKIDEIDKELEGIIKETASIILISNYINVFLKELECENYKVDLEEVALLCIMLYEKYLDEKIEEETLSSFLMKNEKIIKTKFLVKLNVEKSDTGLIN